MTFARTKLRDGSIVFAGTIDHFYPVVPSYDIGLAGGWTIAKCLINKLPPHKQATSELIADPRRNLIGAQFLFEAHEAQV
jgi:hypothetical protein